jgi:hypothetical protein
MNWTNLGRLKGFLLVCILLCTDFTFGQTQLQKRTLDSTSVLLIADSLRLNYSLNKTIPSTNELAILQTLAYFPELVNTKIVFKEARIKTTLNARPTVFSLLFRSKRNRKYVVRINSKNTDEIVKLGEVPFNAQIGLFGHEFNHFVDYSKRSIFGVIGRMFDYTSKKKKELFEKEIDSLTINRGLGWQLYDWSYFVIHTSNASSTYKEFKKNIYLEPEEIRQMMLDAE